MAQIISITLLLCVTSGILNVYCEEYKIINTNNGLVRGRRSVTVLKNISYYSFKGIPYAKPPIDELRFKAPEPADSWKPKVLDASKHGDVCVQPGNFIPLTLPQSEDCLTLNIYLPADIQSDEKLAVLFFIHGGGYVEGSGDQFLAGNDFITERRVILVTINYRLGLFGFLSLGLAEYSGNMGLKDQQLALKWVNENIERFGGDSKRITIFGHSAGSAATHFHILSAESRKFFRNAVCMSGTVENFWAMATNNDNLNFAYRIAEELGEPKSDLANLLGFLHSIDAKKLNPYNIVNLTYGRIEVVAAPVIERTDAIRPFLVVSPATIYETSNIGVNVMFSHTSLELLGTIFHSGYPLLKDLNTNFDLYLPFRGWTLPRDSERYRHLNSQIRQFYFGNETIDEQHILQYVSLFSDLNFVYGIDKATQLHSTKSSGKTFYYRFSVDSKLNVAKGNNSINLPGASHFDDQCYLFRCGLAESIYEDIINMKDDQHARISLRTMDSVIKIITNFAKYDKPTHEDDPVSGFQPIENGTIHFLDINNEGLITGLDPNKYVRHLWARIESFNNEFDELQRNL